jgi:hypothetical protein
MPRIPGISSEKAVRALRGLYILTVDLEQKKGLTYLLFFVIFTVHPIDV